MVNHSKKTIIMKLEIKKEMILIFITILPLLYLAYVWKLLPAEVPTHYNFKGEVDKYSSKETLGVIILIMTLPSYLLMLALPYIDPKKKIQLMGKKFYTIKFLLMGLLSSVAIFILYKTLHSNTKIQFMMVIFGIFLIAMGNYFQTIKQNYFLGIRTPWTLNSEENWKKTHKISGKISMLVGLLMIVSYFILPIKYFSVFTTICIVFLAIFSFTYSYNIYRKENKTNN